MIAVREIGLRYLWVDALCLVQDDRGDLDRGVQNMDIIYERAHLTIIAANGDNAESGLPGVGGITRDFDRLQMELKAGLWIARHSTLESRLDRTVWATRGWTVQEQLLSRRTIIFVDDRVFFRCRNQVVWSEERWQDINPFLDNDAFEVTENSLSYTLAQMNIWTSAAMHYNYLFRALEAFQLRSLTKGDDALRATAGITQRVAQSLGTAFLMGLPICIFNDALCFRFFQKKPPKRVAHFPSWTWAGWTEACEWEYFRSKSGAHDDTSEAMASTVALIQTHEVVENDMLKRRTICRPLSDDHSIPRVLVAGQECILSAAQRDLLTRSTPSQYLAITTLLLTAFLEEDIEIPNLESRSYWNLLSMSRLAKQEALDTSL
jgi:hypothetical protein